MVNLDMGLEMESDFEKMYSSSEQSPDTVLPNHHCPNSEERNTNSKFTRKDGLLKVKEGFTEISFSHYRSTSCKNVPSRSVGVENNIELKRGSIYQNSREVRKMKRTGTGEGRRKIELSRASNLSSSFRIVDPLCSSDEEHTHKRSSKTCVKSNSNRSSVCKPCVEPVSSNGFIDFCPNLDNRHKQSAGTAGCGLTENLNFRCEQVAGPLNDGNGLLERDMALAFNKSLSARAEFLLSPSPPASVSSGASSKSRFSPIRKMFNPFVKSKSMRSPLGNVAEGRDVKLNVMTNTRKNQTCRKSLLHDFSHPVPTSNFDYQLVEKGHLQSAVAHSPVHLHGCLKMETRHGVPFFEFSLNCPEEIFVAKTWKAKNAFSWVYTFHTISSRKKSNASGWGLAEGRKESLAVGQMQVSCYLCPEPKETSASDNSMMTEFVLYDIAHARQSVSSQESPDDIKLPDGSNTGISDAINKVDDGSDAERLEHEPKHAFDKGNFGYSNPYPWATASLHPNLETAAIVIQHPYAKRESLKCKRGDKSIDNTLSDLLSLSMVEPSRKDIHGIGSAEKMKVILPTGHHSLPNCESAGPSSLLDRWSLGGGCDCGGWDMACPLTVFGNPDIQEDQSLIDNLQPLELFVQGTKEKTPAVAMTIVKEGRYAIDFHAQLSTLQAFAICVAVLHVTENSSDTGEEASSQLRHCNSLKVLIDEEMKLSVDAITEEEKKTSKKMEDIHQSYVLNPPFSPISRV